MDLLQRLKDLGFLARTVASLDPGGLASALRRYQEHHQIPATGYLDGETHRSLEAHRFCAHPDVMPVSLEINKWPDPRIRWALASSNWPGLEYARVREAFAWAWSQWEAVCGIAPEFAESPGQAHVVIECARIDQPGQVLAWSELANNTMQAKRQRYDASENWAYTESPRPHEIDLARVAGHEIGHVLGIGHIASGNLLQPTYDTRIRGPQAGDIAEARARYGPPRNVPPPSPPHPPTPVSAGELTIKVKQAGGKFSVDLGPGFRVIPI